MPEPTATRLDRGFTLVEILIAIVLVGILSTVVVVGVGNLTSTGSAAACTASADAANTGVNTYFATNAAYPTSLTQLTSAVPPALVLPSGVSIDASGLVASSTGWTMAMSTDGSGGPPVFLCGGDLPAGFTIGPNGHFYRFVAAPLTRDAAAIAARSVTSGPLTGYLVSVTSSAENAFVRTLVGGATAWISANDIDSENTWRWADGPESGQQFWSGKGSTSGGVAVNSRWSNWYGTGEPNSDGEDCAHVYADGTWNDISCTNTYGYVVELGGWGQPTCAALDATVTAAAEAFRSSTGSYPTAVSQLLAAAPPVLTLQAGITVDPGGMAVSTSSYTVALFPNGAAAPDVVCSDAPPPGWILGSNGHLYRFVTTASTWSAATTAAALVGQFGRIGHLATVTSPTEATTVARLQGGASAWIGGSDGATEDAWFWVAGTESGTQFWTGKWAALGGVAVGGQFTNWATGEPNTDPEDCLHNLSDGRWNDLSCAYLLGYVIEVDP